MLSFPKSTEFSRRIPKQKFYEKLEFPPVLRRAFSSQLQSVYWRNKLAPATLRMPAGKYVSEIEVFEIRLNVPQPDKDILKQIDRTIPYHILFVLTFNGRVQAWIGYKEASASGALKTDRYYHTRWMPESELHLGINGLDMDAVYENFVRQIAGGDLQTDFSESLKESIERDEKKKQLEMQIGALENKIRREKQLNRQMEMNAELKRLKKEFSVVR